MKVIIYLFILISFISFPINAKKTIDPGFVDILEVVDKDMIVILDSIVEHEKRCDYYDSGLIFGIGFYGGNIVSIGTIGKRIAKSESIMGCFYYKKHLFFVVGRLYETIFKKTSQRMQYNFAVSQSGIDPKTGIYFMDSMDMQDDTYSYWTYKYKDNKFTFIGSSTFCK